MIVIDRHVYLRTVARTRLINGIAEYFEERMLAPLDPVGTENHSRLLTDTIRSFQRGYRLIVIFGSFLCHFDHPFF